MRGGYSGAALGKKLGIRGGDCVLLDGAPAEFVVDGLPDGARVNRRAGVRAYDVILMFCPDADRLHHGRVDVKVYAIDDVWSALKHVVRKADR
jgi:hypothetical protein